MPSTAFTLIRRAAAVCAVLLTASVLAAPLAQADNTPRTISQVLNERTDGYGPTVFCRANTVIISQGNSLYVSTDLDQGGDDEKWGMLRAGWARSIGPWELFTLCYDGTNFDGVMTLRSQANNMYVSAEFGYTGSSYAMLRARASSVGPWEQFYLRNNWNGTWSISIYPGTQWVSAELGFSERSYGMLRARSGSAGPWEIFSMH